MSEHFVTLCIKELKRLKSAFQWGEDAIKEYLVRAKDKSLENMLKPRTEPRGTPDRISLYRLKVLFKQILRLLLFT